MNGRRQVFAAWEYAIWYLFLLLWMQGMAVLNVMWGLLLLLMFRHLSDVRSILRNVPVRFRWVIGGYFIWRCATTLWAPFPGEAVVGLFDDVRAITIGLVSLLFFQERVERVRAAWLSFTGVTVLSWWSLGRQVWDGGLLSGRVVFGTFADLNYSAAYSMIAMLIMMYALSRLPFRKGWPLLLGIVPIALLQIPLGSRTALLAAAVGCVFYLFFTRERRVVIVFLAVAVGMTGLTRFAPQLVGQFASLATVGAQVQGKVTMPSLQIRWEIWMLLWQVTKGHPLGIGPRNHGYIDLTPYRDWIAQNMPTAFPSVFGAGRSVTDVADRELVALSYDPHSQYVEALVDGGLIGLFFLLALLALPLFPVRSSSTVRTATVPMMVSVWMLFWCGFTVALFHQAGLTIYLMLLAYSLLDEHKVDRQEWKIGRDVKHDVVA